MSWVYVAGSLTSTGGTEAAPDSVMAGIDIVEAADPTKAYRDGLVGWLSDTIITVSAGSFIIFDDDSTTLVRGTGYVKPQSGGVIHGNRSKLVFEGSANAQGSACSFLTGSTLIARRYRPQDPSPQVIWRNSVRIDYPSFRNYDFPAKIDIAGLDFYLVPGHPGGLLAFYFGNATLSSAKNIRVFGSGCAIYNSTLDDLYVEYIGLGPEGALAPVVLNRPTSYNPTAVPIGGSLRGTQATVRNPTFLNNSWNQQFNFGTCNTGSFVKILYTFKHICKYGLTALEGAAVRYTRDRQSAINSPTWTAPDAIRSATTDVNGTFVAVDLLDAYREGAAALGSLQASAIERFNWTAKARLYDKRTAGETIFANRVFYQGSTNMSAGYTEEVQMLDVPQLTLTQSEAAALTGMAFVASGTSGGTVTISENVSASDLWHYYRQWISQLANFDTEDNWSFDGTTIITDGWDIAINSGVTFDGSVTTTGTVTLTGSASVTGTIIDATADSALVFVGITNWIAYPTSVDRDANTNALASGLGSENFRFNYVPATTYYLRLSAGDVIFKDATPTSVGETVVDLSTAGLLTVLPNLIDTVITDRLDGADLAGVTAQAVWEHDTRTLNKALFT
jgi:hypothetical protein